MRRTDRESVPKDNTRLGAQGWDLGPLPTLTSYLSSESNARGAMDLRRMTLESRFWSDAAHAVFH